MGYFYEIIQKKIIIIHGIFLKYLNSFCILSGLCIFFFFDKMWLAYLPPSMVIIYAYIVSGLCIYEFVHLCFFVNLYYIFFSSFFFLLNYTSAAFAIKEMIKKNSGFSSLWQNWLSTLCFWSFTIDITIDKTKC